jgi:hypothetical protein
MNDWPEWNFPINADGRTASVGISVMGQPLESVLQIIHEQLEYLRHTGGIPLNLTNISIDGPVMRNNPTISKVSDLGIQKEDIEHRLSAQEKSHQVMVKELMHRIASLEDKLLEKDQFYVSVIDEINTRLYHIEGKQTLHSSDIKEIRENVLSSMDALGIRFDNMNDLHTGLKLEIEAVDTRSSRDIASLSESILELKSDTDIKYELLKSECVSIRVLTKQLMSQAEEQRTSQNNNISLVSEFQRKLNNLQEQENGILERVIRLDKDLSQVTYSVSNVRASVDTLNTVDIVRLNGLVERLNMEKANHSDLDCKADKQQLQMKVDLIKFSVISEEVEKCRSDVSSSLKGMETKLNKKLSKLSDFTARHIRHYPQEEAADDGQLNAGAGRMKCLVCDHPIRGIEGEPRHAPANFYNTVGMLRYRKAYDERGQRTELTKLYEEQQGSPMSTLLDVPVSRSPLPMHDDDPPRKERERQTGMHISDAQFEYAKHNK